MVNRVSLPHLRGFIIVHDSFEERPWGVIVPQTEDALKLGFKSSLAEWQKGMVRWQNKYGAGH